jgi:heat shock protein HtpX
MFKRVFLFLITNILVMTTISIVLSLLGVTRYINAYGSNLTQVAIFCLVWGMAGSLISLALSRFMAKMSMGVQVIDPNTANPTERQLLNTVYDLSRKAGLTTMPEVGIYDSYELNAFATGPTRNRSLVAVSSGLLQRMSPGQVEGVLAHEVAHVANGDMVTMTLIQGVVNAFVMFLARIIAFAISQTGDEEKRQGTNYMVVFALEMVLGILGMMVVAAFSRWREYRADNGGATLASRGKMVAALQGLQAAYERPGAVDNAAPALAAFKISGRRSGFLAFFSTHPPLEERIARLQATPGLTP